MREIKFRAWSPQSNKMIEVSELFIHPNITSLRGRDNDGSSLYTYTATGNEGYDSFLMQYTGLKDKNGKEIFEGDIVKTGEANMPIDRYPDYHQVCQVKFGEGEVSGSEWPVSVLGFYLEPHRFEVPNITEAKLEVIGNIYENPTLLESN